MLIARLWLAGGLATVVMATSACAPTVSAPEARKYDKYKFNAVGTWHFLDNWKKYQSRFRDQQLPSASGGKLTANARARTELEIKGHRVMSGLKNGTYDAAHADAHGAGDIARPLAALKALDQ